MKMKPKIGLIGVGAMGSYLLEILMTRLKDEVEVVAACDEDKDKLKKAEELGVGRLYSDYLELLDKEELDGVIIATPPWLHKEQAIESLKRGLYVLLEKPMATNLNDALEISRHASNRLMVAFSLRFHNLYRKVKNYLNSDLGSVVTQWHIALGKVPSTKWIGDIKLSGGMVNENSIHVLYVFYWYAGRVKEVYASTWRLTPNITIEDNAAVMLKHDGGAVSTLIQSWTTSHRWRKWGVQAKEGTVTCEGYLTGEYRISRQGNMLEEGVFDEPIENIYINELRSFLNSIINNEKPEVNEEDGIHIHKVIDSIYRSSREGKPIQVS